MWAGHAVACRLACCRLYGTGTHPLHTISLQMEDKLVVLKAELQYQEEVYHQAYEKHVMVQENFDRDVKELFLVRNYPLCPGIFYLLADILFRIFKRKKRRESTPLRKRYRNLPGIDPKDPNVIVSMGAQS